MHAISRGLARIGVLVPFTNTNLEADMALLRPDGLSFHYARLGGYDRDEIPDEAQMAGLGASDLDEPLELLMGVRPDVVMYGCTSATLTHGPAFDSDLASKISLQSGAATVTAAGALITALQALDVTQIGFASPYVAKINGDAISFLAGSGIETVHRSEVTEALDNYGQGELTPQRVFDLGRAADHPDAQAVVLSCTDMRGVEIIDRLESELCKPVITSNQAMLFAAMRHLGQCYDKGFGQLYQRLIKEKV
ncbi:MAG: Asp/Glu racemase [Paracoccaceae bacterium]